jgi:flagellar protein FliO/FliZ
MNMRSYRLLLFYLLLSFMPLMCFGQESASNHAPPLREEGEDRFLYEFMNMLTTLGLIVAAILFISWFLKRMVNTRIQQVNTTSLIKIIERRALSPKATLYLVEIYNKHIIVGETATGIANMGEFSIEGDEDNGLETTKKHFDTES